MTEIKKRILSNVMSLILGAGIGAGAYALKDRITEPEFPGIEVSTPEEVGGGGILNKPENHGIEMVSTKIAREEYEANGISPMAENAYTLTATIEPENASNKAVDWSVEFVDPSSSWASGKSVTDYVTVTPTSDGALTATVANLGAFGEQIKVTVTSRDNPEATAECMVEYQQKFESLAGYISLDAESDEKTNFSSTADTRCYIDFPLTDDSPLEYLTHTSEISITPVGSDIYTLPMDYNLTKVEMKVAANINRGFVEYPANFIMSHQELSELTGVTYKNGKCTGKTQEFMGISDYSNGNISAAKSNLYGVLSGGNDSERFSEYKLYYSINGEEKYFSFYLTYRLESLKTKVSAVTVDNERITF